MNKKTTPNNKTDMNKLRLEKVDYKNFVSLCRLKVKRDQQNFVASNVFSLAEAYVAGIAGGYPQPFGFFLGDKPVGFLMVGYYDKKYQGKGYGKEALQLALDYIRTFPVGEAKYCWLSYEPENETARNLYRSFGFEEVKEMPKGWDEIPAVMEL